MVEKKRKRVPVSCLNCKKRKVKCDKVKPSCGGCTKNGVGHLCQYLEPHWCKDEDSDKDAIIISQKNKIQTLQNQLDLLQEKLARSGATCPIPPVTNTTLIPSHNESNPIPSLTSAIPPVPVNSHSSPNHPVTILNKLRPLSVTSRDEFLIYCQSNYQIELVNNRKYFVDKYSWMSLIKLDPRLINLWLKMIRFHHYYIIYKRYQQNQKNPPMLTLNTADKCPVIKPSTIVTKLSESKCPVVNVQPTQSEDKSQCPVFDTSQLIDTESSSKMVSPTPAPLQPVTNGSTSVAPETDSNGISENLLPNTLETSISLRISRAMNVLRNVWESMITLDNSTKINDLQLHFLMEFYFTTEDLVAFDSRNIFSFYRSEITGIVIKRGNSVMFDCTGFMKAEKNHALLQDILVKGSYLCMLAIIVDETLTYLRRHSLEFPTTPTSIQFAQLFPSQAMGQPQKREVTNIYLTLEDFLANLRWNNNSEKILRPFMPFVVVTIAWINQQILHYNKRDLPPDTRARFTEIMKSFFKLLLSEDAMIEIWKDPYSIRFKDSSVKRDSDLATHLTFTWTELVRLNNLLTFKCVPLVKNSEVLDGLIRRLYLKVGEADYAKCHLTYLEELKSKQTKFKDLIITLKSHFLLSRINYIINHGTMCLGDPRITVEMLQDLITESIQQSNIVTQLNDPLKKFELSCLLQYLSCYIAYVILLQGEENKDSEIISLVIPDYFVRFAKFIDFLGNEVQQDRNTPVSQYTLLIVTDFITKSMQVVTGLLIRINSEETNTSQDVLMKNQIKQYETFKPLPLSITALISKNMTTSIENAIDLLLKSSYIDQEKIAKLSNRWTDYLTITSKVNYSEVHRHLPELAGKFFSNDQSSNGLQPKTNQTNHREGIIPSGEFRRCPISHITTTMDDNPDAPKILGVLAHQSLDAKADLDRKRKCPFGQTPAPNTKYSALENPGPQNGQIMTPGGQPMRVGADVPYDNKVLNGLENPKPDMFPVPTFDFNSLSELNFEFLQQDVPLADWNLTNDLLGDMNFNL